MPHHREGPIGGGRKERKILSQGIRVYIKKSQKNFVL
jgi:hypothetical protein